MPSVEQFLRVENLGVKYDNVHALNDISLNVARGERLALLGHNGAGKTTLIKTILGFVAPTTGSILVGECSPNSSKSRQAVSYLPEAVMFPQALSGAEIISYFARLKGVAPRHALPLLERVGIGHAAKRRVGTYSKGMRQRLGLAQALIGTPELLLLDEPTSGLDPISRQELYALIDEVAQNGTSILHSSHSLRELEGQTDRVMILSKGRKVAEGTIDELASLAALPIKIHVRAQSGQTEDLFSKIGGQRINGQSIVLSCLPQDKLEILARVTHNSDQITDLDISKPGLDEIYRFFSQKSEEGEINEDTN